MPRHYDAANAAPLYLTIEKSPREQVTFLSPAV